MNTTTRTPLEAWIGARIGLSRGERLSAAHLAAWQLAQLNATLAHVWRHSAFYQKRLGGRALPRLAGLEEIGALPFTSAADLRQDALSLLCGSQSEVARVVTLRTSGTTGDPKRIFFGDDDLEATIDFFHHGMSTLVRPGERVLILLPGESPDSVGDLLRRGLARLGAEGIVHGPVSDPAATLQTIRGRDVHSLVGIPAQVLALARHPEGAALGHGKLRGVLLSTDYVPRAVTAAIETAWDCQVFQHYGMTEMGFGGGVECLALSGYHLREADLLFEIVDPVSGQPTKNGRTGEVVVTTLNRRVMPLLRYRTGDLAAWIDAPCPCRSVLRRMRWVQGRRQEMPRLADGIVLEKHALDEALFSLPEAIDYRAVLESGGDGEYLRVTLCTYRDDPRLPFRAAAALALVPAIRAATANGRFRVAPIAVEQGFASIAPTAKRMIVDRRTNVASLKEVSV
ncbi:MAG: phenylacetate--CoA ligase family protein [Desulfobacterales bacterium]|nr:phenylacetate--CoA ligase family protein [Desulfobacterales bacterium]